MKTLPEGFVYLQDYLQDHCDNVQENMVYASKHNFVGAKVDGYDAPAAILTLQAAKALALVASDVARDCLGLVIYDAYRPQRAVNHFLAWSKSATDPFQKAKYHPYFEKDQLFALGYLAARSSHTRGSTVDLTLIERDKQIAPVIVAERQLQDGRITQFLDDGSLDMGASFDLFDEASWHDTTLVAKQHLERRHYLRAKFEERGFVAFAQEWWHYTLADEPFADQYFDFTVTKYLENH